MKRPLWLVLVILLMLALAGAWLTRNMWLKPKPVIISGLIQGREFKNASRVGGRVQTVLAQEGDWVKKGQVIVTFDDTELKANLEKAEAGVQQAQAQQSLVTQPNVQDLRAAQAQIDQAQQKKALLLKGADSAQIAAAQSKLVQANEKLQAAQTEFSNADQLLEKGLISQNAYNNLKAQVDLAQSAVDAADKALKQLKKGANTQELAIADAQIKAAKAQYDRLATLGKTGQGSAASATVKQAQSTRDAVASQQSELELTAPIDGVLSVLNAQPDELILPSRPVFVVVDYNDLWTDIYVPESQLKNIRLNQDVTLHCLAYPKTVFKGQVVFINPQSEFVPGESRATATEEASFRVKVKLLQQQPITAQTLSAKTPILYPGMQVQVIFP